MHVEIDVAPLLGEYCPAAHEVHAAATAPVLPASPKLPAAQAVPPHDVVPLLGEYCPAAHEVHAAAPLLGEYCPAAHEVHAAATAPVLPAGPKLPAAQAVPPHDVAPLLGEYCPAAHEPQPQRQMRVELHKLALLCVLK